MRRFGSTATIGVALMVFSTTAANAAVESVPPAWTAVVRHDPSGFVRLFGQEIVLSPDGSRLYMLGSAYRENVEGWSNFMMGFAADTGSHLWRTPVGRARVVGFGMSPDGDSLYVAMAAFERPVTLKAIATATGEPLWSVRMRGIYQQGEFAVGADGTVYVATEVSVAGTHREQTLLSAFEPATGSLLWRTKLGEEYRYFEPDSLTVSPDGDVVVLGAAAQDSATASCPRASGAAFSADDGSVIWLAAGVRMPGCGEVSAVAVTGSTVLLSSYGMEEPPGGRFYEYVEVTARSLVDGTRMWRERYRDLSSATGSSAVVDPAGATAVVWGQTGHDTSAVIRFDLASGATLVRHSVPFVVGDARFSPDGATMFLAGGKSSSDGSSGKAIVRAMILADGTWLWKGAYRDPSLPNAGWWHLAVAADGGALFVCGRSAGIGEGSATHVIVAAYPQTA